jgi:hypothetical protein
MSLIEWLPWVRERRTRELADELRMHLEMAKADRIGRGESASDAAANARREFGNVGLVQEVARDRWAGITLERFGQDVRVGLRMLRRAPTFTTVAVLTIALGIGATTAIFSVVDATLLHPLPFPHAEQLVRIEDDLLGVGAQDVGMSTPEWKDLERSGVFEYVSPTWFDDNNLTGLSRPQRVGLLLVAPNYFALLGVKPQLGVTFDPADPTPGFNEQIVISDGLWRRARRRSPCPRPRRAAGFGLISRHRRHAGGVSVAGANEGGTQRRSMAGDGIRGHAVDDLSTPEPALSRCDRPAQVRTDDHRSTAADRCPRCVAAPAISSRLSATQ